MSFFTLDAELVDELHDEVVNPGEVPGRARDKSLERALARVKNRLAYGMIEDVFDLAAMYAVAVATGHCFNDANKRTTFRAMDAALAFNDAPMAWDTIEVGEVIVTVAQSRLDAKTLAAWLRAKAGQD